MRGKSHLISGITTGFVTAAFTFSGSFVGAGAAVCASAIGSLIPDIDLPTSAVGRCLKPISFLVNKMFGHRTITHAAIWVVPLLILYFNLSHITAGMPDIAINIINGAMLGYISGFCCHLIGDMLTKGGIPLFYPFSRKRVRLTSFESGKHDLLLTIFTFSAFILFWFVMYKNNFYSNAFDTIISKLIALSGSLRARFLVC